MVQVSRLTARLRELSGVTRQAHVDPLHGAALAAGRGEDDPGEQGGAGVSLACGGLSITEIPRLQTWLVCREESLKHDLHCSPCPTDSRRCDPPDKPVLGTDNWCC